MISLKQFVTLWKNYSAEFTSVNKDWKKYYQSNKEWTRRFVGEKKSSEENSPFGKFLRTNLKTKHFRARTEDGLYDLSISTQPNHTIKTTEKLITEIPQDHFYPISCDVVIEFENNPKLSWQEMIKLVYVRAHIKALVTYTSYDNDPLKSKLQAEQLKTTFQDVIAKTHGSIPEADRTKYVLLFGKIEENDLKWTTYAFKTNGEEISINGS